LIPRILIPTLPFSIPGKQGCGSMAFWCGSHPDADPDPPIFIIDLQDANKNNLFKKFFCILLFEGTFTHHFSKRKSQKEVTKQYKSRFFILFLLYDRRIRIYTSD
jgi:hypothetical protein